MHSCGMLHFSILFFYIVLLHHMSVGNILCFTPLTTHNTDLHPTAYSGYNELPLDYILLLTTINTAYMLKHQ